MNKEVKTLDAIMTMVCRYYSIDKKLVLGKKRDREIVMARQMFCWLSRRYTRSTFKLMGEYINRNHATVLHSVRKVEELIDFDRELKYDRDTIVDMNPQLNNISNLIYNIEKVSKYNLYMYDIDGFGKVDKSTCTWVVTFGNRVYTIYDWKTYDREYTINELNTWSIGGVSSLVYFKDALMNLIDASLVSLNK